MVITRLLYGAHKYYCVYLKTFSLLYLEVDAGFFVVGLAAWLGCYR
jgi:hypothetical protein